LDSCWLGVTIIKGTEPEAEAEVGLFQSFGSGAGVGAGIGAFLLNRFADNQVAEAKASRLSFSRAKIIAKMAMAMRAIGLRELVLAQALSPDHSDELCEGAGDGAAIGCGGESWFGGRSLSLSAVTAAVNFLSSAVAGALPGAAADWLTMTFFSSGGGLKTGVRNAAGAAARRTTLFATTGAVLIAANSLDSGWADFPGEGSSAAPEVGATATTGG
jgi:hypothetical protein